MKRSIRIASTSDCKTWFIENFQQTRIYGKLNCVENMLISHKDSDANIMSIFSKIPKDLTERAENLLNFVGLYQKRKLESRRFIIWPAKIIRTCYGFNERTRNACY